MLITREQKIEAAKSYLNVIRTNQTRIWQLRFDRQQLKLDYSAITGIDYSADKIQKTPQNGIENAGWQLLERLKRIDKQINMLSDERYKRIDEIQKLTDVNLSMVLSLYYVHNMSQKRIGEFMCYSEKQIGRIYHAALERFYNYFLDRRF